MTFQDFGGTFSRYRGHFFRSRRLFNFLGAPFWRSTFKTSQKSRPRRLFLMTKNIEFFTRAILSKISPQLFWSSDFFFWSQHNFLMISVPWIFRLTLIFFFRGQLFIFFADHFLAIKVKALFYFFESSFKLFIKINPSFTKKPLPTPHTPHQLPTPFITL